jgi:hypothetical protein
MEETIPIEVVVLAQFVGGVAHCGHHGHAAVGPDTPTV